MFRVRSKKRHMPGTPQTLHTDAFEWALDDRKSTVLFEKNNFEKRTQKDSIFLRFNLQVKIISKKTLNQDSLASQIHHIASF